MLKQKVIGRLLSTTPTGSKLFGDPSHDVPEDLLREAAARLGIISLLGVVLWTIGGALDHLAMKAMRPPGDPFWRQFHPPDAIVALGILSSLALFLYSRRSQRSPRFLLDLGLVYLVFTSLDIALISHWDPVPRGWTVQPMFSWAGSLVLMFAAILPNPPGKTLVAGLIAATMNPIGMLIARSRGVWEFGSTGNVLLMHYPDYIMVGVSVVISRVVTRLGQHVTRAREMGSYQLGDLLSRGGMGEIYKATHRMLARPAAIKLIRREMLGNGNGELAELAIRRFRREAEVAASLRSPHTVELYDFGVTDDETLYFVMELLDGMDLQELVSKHGPQPANRVIHILTQVCESLEEAHARGLVHRDIKPPNIHLGRLGVRHDFVKVLDFGLVKPVARAGARAFAGDRGRHHAGNAGLHGAGDGPGRAHRRTRRSLRPRLRRLLSPHGTSRLRVHQRAAVHRASHQRCPTAALAVREATGATGAGTTGTAAAGQASGRSPRQRRRAGPLARRRRGRGVDRGGRGAVVDQRATGP